MLNDWQDDTDNDKYNRNYSENGIGGGSAGYLRPEQDNNFSYSTGYFADEDDVEVDDSPGDTTYIDERISRDVRRRLNHHEAIDPINIRVSVLNNVVTLDGTVDDADTRRLSEEIAQKVFGVKSVRNLLRVLAEIE